MSKHTDFCYTSHYHAVNYAIQLLNKYGLSCEQSPLCRIGNDQYRTVIVFGIFNIALHITTILTGENDCTLFFHKESKNSLWCLSNVVDKFELHGDLSSKEDNDYRENDIKNTLIKLGFFMPEKEETPVQVIRGPKVYKDSYGVVIIDYSTMNEKRREDPKRCINYGAIK